jgi:hypothetical protein
MTKQRYKITISYATQPFEHAKGIVDEREVDLTDYSLSWLISLLDLFSTNIKKESDSI